MTSRHQRYVAWLFIVTGMCTLAAAAYCYFTPFAGAAVQARETDFEFADCVAGEKREVIIALQNNSGHPIRVLGYELC